MIDGGELVAWIVAQPWSNGRVGGWGVSYEGTAAQFLAVSRHPALKAVVPEFMEYDVYRHIAFPGGVFNDRFVREWSAANALLDSNRICDDASPGCEEARRLVFGVKPVDDDAGRTQLEEAVRQHQDNPDVYRAASEVTFRDDFSQGFQSTMDRFSVHRYGETIARSGVAIFGWGSWMDGATAEAVLNRLATLPNPQRAIIGPWNHGADRDADPYNPPDAPDPDVTQRIALVTRFFDHHLKAENNGVEREPRLTYYTLGEGAWRTSDVWPIAGTIRRRLYLSGGNALAAAPSRRAAPDVYHVNFEASTGEGNRWLTELSAADVVYPDRSQEDAKLLTYTGPPLAADTEITGSPVVQLFVASTHADGAFFAYLEDVDELGRVTYLTEGQLRALHRRIAAESQGYREFAPRHSYRRQDARPLEPGRVTSLRFGLNPLSALIKRGHRIRLAIAGHDASMFERIPATGTPVIRVFRDEQRASFVELPIVPRD